MVNAPHMVLAAPAPGRDFLAYCPGVNFFEKSDGKRYFGGFMTTEGRDLAGERVIQKSLDISYFEKHGYFNDNHSKENRGVLGKPTKVAFVKKGEKAPNGRVAPNDAHYVEGRLYKGYKPADEIWDLAKAMEADGDERRLGFSVQGGVHARDPFDPRDVTKAIVRQCAITFCPTNPETSMDTLVKSLQQVDDEVQKMFTAGAAMPGFITGGPVTGDGAGRVLGMQDLEHRHRGNQLSKSQAVGWMMSIYPGITCEDAGRAVDFALTQKRMGLL